MRDVFRQFSRKTADLVGSSTAFLAAVVVVAAWAITGPLFHYSDSWQLVINTATTIVTFLMVFLIQNTQNRDATVTQLKLDELLRAIKAARTDLVDLDRRSDEELARLKCEFEALSERTSGQRSVGEKHAGTSPLRTAGHPSP